MNHETESVVRIRKRRIPIDQRMVAKLLLHEVFPEVQGAGQLILHFNPGKNALFIEWQEREEKSPTRIDHGISVDRMKSLMY